MFVDAITHNSQLPNEGFFFPKLMLRTEVTIVGSANIE